MVVANGHRTRARMRAVGGDKVGETVLLADHPFIAPGDQYANDRREMAIKEMGRQLKTFSPATRRLLDAAIKASVIEHREQKRFKLRPASRKAIADQLGRKSLVPYDVTILRNLCTAGILTEHRQPLPRKQYGGIWLGSGMQYVYTFNRDKLVCILWLHESYRPQLQALREAQQYARYIGEYAPLARDSRIPDDLQRGRGWFSRLLRKVGF